jgi:hypothetical protein
MSEETSKPCTIVGFVIDPKVLIDHSPDRPIGTLGTVMSFERIKSLWNARIVGIVVRSLDTGELKTITEIDT